LENSLTPLLHPALSKKSTRTMGVGHFVEDIREHVHFVQAKESFM
jgi:hypothetical protein